jgi:hypothetical protein
MNKGNELLLKILFLKVKKFGPIKYQGNNLLIFFFFKFNLSRLN